MLLCVAAAVSVVSVIAMQWTPLLVFTQCDFAVHWVAMMLFLSSMFAMGMMFGSCVHSPVRVQVVSAMLLLFVVIFQAVIAIGTNTSAINTWEANYNPSSSAFWLVAWNLLPWWHYGKVFQTVLDTTGVKGQVAAVNTKSAGTYNSTSVLTAKNSTYYNWTNIYDPLGQKGINKGLAFEADYDVYGEKKNPDWFAPSTADTFGYMVALTLMYMALAWYFGQVVGARMSVVFCMDPTYWGCSKKKTGFVAGDTLAQVQSESLRDGTLRTHKMTKAYAGNTALRELSLEHKVGRVLGLLGHNGAGKTTAIGCMTGAHNPTHGEAFIFGHSVRHDKKVVQKFMGVCPQDDILFAELTAYEHLTFWTRFRAGATVDMNATVAQTLKDINLEREAHILASTFSGGMKRRLSVGISVMANPKLLFFDEPTTGLDPLSRKRLWDMIRRLKKDKIVVLT